MSLGKDLQNQKDIKLATRELMKYGPREILVTHETYIAQHAYLIIHILDGKIDSDCQVKNHRCAKKYFQK